MKKKIKFQGIIDNIKTIKQLTIIEKNPPM